MMRILTLAFLVALAQGLMAKSIGNTGPANTVVEENATRKDSVAWDGENDDYGDGENTEEENEAEIDVADEPTESEEIDVADEPTESEDTMYGYQGEYSMGRSGKKVAKKNPCKVKRSKKCITYYSTYIKWNRRALRKLRRALIKARNLFRETIRKQVRKGPVFWCKLRSKIKILRLKIRWVMQTIRRLNTTIKRVKRRRNRILKGITKAGKKINAIADKARVPLIIAKRIKLAKLKKAMQNMKRRERRVIKYITSMKKKERRVKSVVKKIIKSMKKDSKRKPKNKRRKLKVKWMKALKQKRKKLRLLTLQRWKAQKVLGQLKKKQKITGRYIRIIERSLKRTGRGKTGIRRGKKRNSWY